MRNLKAIALGLVLTLASVTGAMAQCGTTAPANKFCGNDTGSSALATYKSIPAGALSAIAGGTVLGNPTGALAVPSATAAPVLGIPGTSTGQIGLAGSAGGTAILKAQATAGSAISLLPTVAGTLVGSSSAPLVIGAATGTLTCPTCVTSSGGGAITGTSPITVSAAGVVALTTPLALNFGGTNANLTASNGGIVWSNATQMQILAGTATARQMLQSGATATPAWSTATWPATTTINQILYSSSANVVTGLASANSSVLVTDSGGIPSFSTTLPTLGPLTVTTTSASALAVGQTGANPAFRVNTLTASSVTGVEVGSQALAGGVTVGVISSGTNEGIAINAKGSAPVTIANVSTGGVNLAAGGGGVTATAIQGGSAAGSSITIKSTTNGSPSGDVASLLGSTVTIGNPTVGTSTINLSGPVGGGVTVNIAGASNGLTALNVFNSTGGKQIWIPGAGGSPGTIQFPATADTLVGKATTDAFTNKTFNSTATGNVLQVSGVTVSAGQYPGETTTGSATAGNVGEYVESVITSGSAVSLVSGAPKTITSITLTAGDWEVDTVAQFFPANTTQFTQLAVSLSLSPIPMTRLREGFFRFRRIQSRQPEPLHTVPLCQIIVSAFLARQLSLWW
jgi:hypothetical protein